MKQLFTYKAAFYALLFSTVAFTVAAVIVPALAVVAGIMGGATVVVWQKAYPDAPTETFHVENNVVVELPQNKPVVYMPHLLIFRLIKKLSAKPIVESTEDDEGEKKHDRFEP